MSRKTASHEIVICDYCKEVIHTEHQTDYLRLLTMKFDDDHDVQCYTAAVQEDLHVSCLYRRVSGAVINSGPKNSEPVS